MPCIDIYIYKKKGFKRYIPRTMRLGRTMICPPPSNSIEILLGPCSSLMGDGGDEEDRLRPVGVEPVTISVIVCDNRREALVLLLEHSVFVAGTVSVLAGKEVIIVKED